MFASLFLPFYFFLLFPTAFVFSLLCLVHVVVLFLGKQWQVVFRCLFRNVCRVSIRSNSFRELQNTPDAVPDSGIEPPPLDTAWVEATRKKALLKLEKLDTDLKNYKGNSIKESIRWDAEGSAGARKSILLLQAPNTECQLHSVP